MKSKAARTVGIVGATGFIGRMLAVRLEQSGWQVVRFSRAIEGKGEGWRSSAGEFDLRGLDAVVNLAGESVAQRWTAAVRERLRTSRIGVTDRIVDALRALPPAERPRSLLNASAVGYYGARGEEVLDENSSAGEGFLAELCVDWEAAAKQAEELGVRVVLLRTGIVLGQGGAAWERLWRVFRLGLGGVLGDGRQWMSWIHVEDEVGAIEFLLESEDLGGPVNLCAPEPARNRHFTRVLSRLARRPAVFRVPGFILKALLGGFGGSLVASSRAVPRLLESSGYPFRLARLKSV